MHNYIAISIAIPRSSDCPSVILPLIFPLGRSLRLPILDTEKQNDVYAHNATTEML